MATSESDDAYWVARGKALSTKHCLEALEGATPEQRALFMEHFQPRSDGGENYTLDDHLFQMFGRSPDWTDEKFAKVSGLPVAYWKSLRALPMTDAQKNEIAKVVKERGLS
jgi:hypothetical protein